MSPPTPGLSTIGEIRERALRFVSEPVSRGDLALAFAESRASSVDVHVEGRNFYPQILQDIDAATSSVHINQFGFRPGVVGEAFADALVAKAAAGVPVRLVVDRQGSDPERSSRALYDRLTGARHPGLRRPGDEAACAGRPAGRRRRAPLEPGRARPHRPPQGRDRRRSESAGSAAPASRTISRTVASTTCSSASPARWSHSCSSSSSPASGGSEARFPRPISRRCFRSSMPDRMPFRPSCFTTRPAGTGRSPTRSRASSRSAEETLDVVNPYVTDRRMIRRIGEAARRGVRVRLFVPGNPNNWACAAAQRFHHASLLDAGVRILEYPTMLHAKAFVRDGEELLAGTCNLEAWSLKRFFEIDLQVWSRAVASQFDERFSADAETVSSPGQPLEGAKERAKATAFALLSPLPLTVHLEAAMAVTKAPNPFTAEDFARRMGRATEQAEGRRPDRHPRCARARSPLLHGLPADRDHGAHHDARAAGRAPARADRPDSGAARRRGRSRRVGLVGGRLVRRQRPVRRDGRVARPAGPVRDLRLGLGDARARAAGGVAQVVVRVDDEHAADAARDQGRRRARAARRGRRGRRRELRADRQGSVRGSPRERDRRRPRRASSATTGIRRSISPSSARARTAPTPTTSSTSV